MNTPFVKNEKARFLSGLLCSFIINEIIDRSNYTGINVAGIEIEPVID